MWLSLMALLLACCHCPLTLPAEAATPPVVVETIAAPVSKEGENALDIGNYPRAELIFSSALKNEVKSRTDETYFRIGQAEACLGQGKIAASASQLKKALSLLERQADKSTLMARALDDMAWIYQAQNRLDKALESCQAALDMRKAAKDTDPFHLIGSLIHISYLLDQSGRLEQALQPLQEALALQETKAGPGSVMAADIKERLGSVYFRLGRGDDASTSFQQALAVKFASLAIKTRFAPHPFWDNITYRFWQGAPNCLQRFDQGQQREIITANGITVSAAIASNANEFVKSGRVDLMVENDSDSPVQVLPRPPELVVLAPKVRHAAPLEPSMLAEQVEKRGDKKARSIRLWEGNATIPIYSTVYGPSGCGGYRYGRHYGQTTVVTQVPDYASQARALAKAAEVTERSRASAQAIRSEGLGPTDVPPRQILRGSLYFDTAKITKAVLRIPVGNAVFEFQFPGQ